MRRYLCPLDLLLSHLVCDSKMKMDKTERGQTQKKIVL